MGIYDVRFYASLYRGGGTHEELWRQWWEACEVFGLREVYLYDAANDNGGITIYKLDGMSTKDAIRVLDYLDETYPESHWDISGL